jgi:transposase
MEQILLSPKELNRYEMVQARLKAGNKIEKILSDYAVSRKTFYVNLHKFEREGIEGLKSKWGKHRKTDKNTEEKFVKLFQEHPHFSSYEFSEIINLNPRTIQRIIIRRKLIKSYKPKKERLDMLESIKKNQKLKKSKENKDKESQKKKNRK